MEDEFQRIISQKCGGYLTFFIEYLIPIIAVVCIISNIFNAIVFFLSKEYSKIPVYRYLTANSITDAILFVFYIASIQPLCNRHINKIYSYSYQLFHLLISLYLARVFGMISTFINIQIAYDRLVYIKNMGHLKKYQNKSIKGYIIFFILISAIFYTPNILFNKIYKIERFDNISRNVEDTEETSTLYILYFSEIVQRCLSLKILILMQNFITILYLIIMTVINLIIYNRFRNLFNKTVQFKVRYFSNNQQKLKIICNDENLEPLKCNEIKVNENNRLTIMVIWISSVFIVDQTVLGFGHSVYFFYERRSRAHLTTLVVTLIFRTLCSISNSIFYYLYIQEYRKVVKSILRRK
jgi:hypothetical protein